MLVPAYTFPATANVGRAAGLRPVLVDVDPLDDEHRSRAASGSARGRARSSPCTCSAGPAASSSCPRLTLDRGRGRSARRAPARARLRLARARRLPQLPSAQDRLDRRGRRRTTDDGEFAAGGGGAAQPRLALDGRCRHAGARPQLPALGGALRARARAAAASRRAARRRAALIAAGYAQRLAPSSAALPAADDGDVHGWQAYVVQLERRDEVLRALRAAGIEAQIGTYALPLLGAIGTRGAFPGAPGALRARAGVSPSTPASSESASWTGRTLAAGAAAERGPSGRSRPAPRSGAPRSRRERPTRARPLAGALAVALRAERDE